MSNRRKIRAPLPATFLRRPAGTRATYWNGERAQAARVRLRVADAPAFPGYWAREHVGTIRRAVRVVYGGRRFYLDDEDGSGWRKVTTGHGSPGWPSRSLFGTEVQHAAERGKR
jgi:hypothetical protein